MCTTNATQRNSKKKEKVKISRIWRNEKKRKGKKEGNIIYLFVVQF